MDILVVDDEISVRRMLERALARLGHRVRTAADVRGLEEGLLAGLPEVVFCDVNLGDADGIELCLRSRKANFGLQVVMMTGSPEAYERARGEGFAGVLLKPFHISELAELLTSIAGAKF